jgi:aminoglycoside phosphotransferase (APT) family kinase protein
MWKAPSLPYYCDSSLLPASLPTTEDIKNATCTLVEASSRVVRIVDNFVAKYGPQTRRCIQEGLNMIYVSQNLTTQIPLVYALYEENGNAYLVMQYVAGQTLEHLWPSLEPYERQAILRKLRGFLDDMRSLPIPSPPLYGSVGRGPLPYFLFWTPEPQKEVNGPFVTEKELCLGLVEKLRQIHAGNNQHMSRVEWLQKFLPTSLTGHPPTFTHGDIQKKNIMVERTSRPTVPDNEDEFNLTVLDWEDAGWYPNYFEYFLCYTGFFWDDDWPQMVEICLDPFPVETLVMIQIYHDIFM